MDTWENLARSLSLGIPFGPDKFGSDYPTFGFFPAASLETLGWLACAVVALILNFWLLGYRFRDACPAKDDDDVAL